METSLLPDTRSFDPYAKQSISLTELDIPGRMDWIIEAREMRVRHLEEELRTAKLLLDNAVEIQANRSAGDAK